MRQYKVDDWREIEVPGRYYVECELEDARLYCKRCRPAAGSQLVHVLPGDSCHGCGARLVMIRMGLGASATVVSWRPATALEAMKDATRRGS